MPWTPLCCCRLHWLINGWLGANLRGGKNGVFSLPLDADGTVISPFYVYGSGVLSTFTLLCSQTPELFSSCKTETLEPLNVNLPAALGMNHSAFSLSESECSRYLLLWVKSYYICLFVSDFFHLANALKIHPCHSMFRNRLPFSGWVIFPRVHTPHFIYPLICK